MKRKIGLALLVAGLATGPLAADDVLLTNGEVFEGVIASLDGNHVQIRLEFGELRLPAASVERIDSSRSSLREYLDRQLLLEEGGTASEWLELARWARSRDLDHSYREALLEAARLDPALEGLDAEMRGLGYVLEAELDRWIPYDEHMRRAGMVRHRGEWVQPEERVAESRGRVDEHREIEQTLSRTVELLAMAQLERESRESREARQTAPAGPAAPYGFPVAYFPGYYVAPPAHSPSDGRTDPGRAPGNNYDDVSRRPPGSLLPVGGTRSGGRIRQPGSLIPSASGN